MRDSQRVSAAALVVVSFLILFLEISLIRWLSTEVRIFAYVNNLVLLTCFLGIGVGCQRAGRPARLAISLGSLGALLILISAPIRLTLDGQTLPLFKFTPVLLSVFSDSLIWYEMGPERVVPRVAAGMAATLLIFALIVAIFVPLGQVLGRQLDAAGHRIAAYSLNVAASLAGVWCFNLLSFGYRPPWMWFGISLAGIGILIRWVPGRGRILGASFAACALAIGFVGILEARDPDPVIWSPYQKLKVEPLAPERMERGFQVLVNDAGYMALLNLSDTFTAKWPQVTAYARKGLGQYELPTRFKPAPESVLIVGAGGGNDVAGALRNGAGRVTAVEIDPGIRDIGLR